MKTLKNIKRMVGMVAMLGMVMVAAAGTPKQIYNDTYDKEGRLAVREICIDEDGTYQPSLRDEMTYQADGSLASKTVYQWNSLSRRWKLLKSYRYTERGIEVISYNEKGKATSMALQPQPNNEPLSANIK